MSNLEVTAGDAYVNVRHLIVGMTDEAGAALDLTGLDLTFMVKRYRYDDDADALITKRVGDGVEIASPQTGDTKGVAYIELDEADTEDIPVGRYAWGIRGVDVVGKVTPVQHGNFYVRIPVVRTP